MNNPQFTDDQINNISEMVNIHLSLPMKYELTGSNFETLFAIMIGGKKEKRKLLFDVIKENIGWSLKTLQSSSARFEIVLKRCNVISKDMPWQTADPQIIGDAIIDNLNGFYSNSVLKQTVIDKRLCVLLFDKQTGAFRIFQSELKIYEKEDIEWQFSKTDKKGNEKKDIKSLMGFHDGKLVFRWYKSGTQLFGVYEVPEYAQSFQLDQKEIKFDDLIDLFKKSERSSGQSQQQQEELLNFQLDDIESDSSP